MTHDIHNDPVLDSMLEMRHFEPHRGDLAERIIHAARGHSQKAAVSLHGWLQSLFADFALPRPAYVLASLLCLGFIAGLDEQITLSDEDNTPFIQTFLYDENEGEIL